jgi:hypothetical protein
MTVKPRLSTHLRGPACLLGLCYDVPVDLEAEKEDHDGGEGDKACVCTMDCTGMEGGR